MRRLYRLALRLHPAGFRRAFGAEMERVFLQRCEAARRTRGRLAAWLVAAGDVADVLRSASRHPIDARRPMGPIPERTTATMLHHIGKDFTCALRQLRQRPGFSGAIVGTLALAIGANAATFTIVNAVLLRPLPYPEADGIVRVFAVSERGGALASVSPLDWLDYPTTGAFESTAAFDGAEMTLTGDGEAEPLQGAAVTRDFFRVFRTPPALGRTFQRGDADARGVAQAVIMSHALWQRRFGGDATAIGRTIRLNGRARTVVGVMPPRFAYPENAAFWLPLEFTPDDLRPNQRGAMYLSAVARLKPGVTVEEADARVADLARRLAREYPRSNEGRGGRVLGLHAFLVRNVRTALLSLLGAVALVLLIACANVGNLFLARAASRETEVAIRSSLGATRGRILQQFLVEGLVLALLGGAAGVLLASWGTQALLALAPAELPLAATAAIDARVLLFACALTVPAGVVFGLAPAIHLPGRPHTALAQRGATLGRRHRFVQQMLIVAELALAIVLLAGAGLLTRSFVRIAAIDPGFDARNVQTFVVGLPAARYEAAPEVLGFYERLRAEIRSIPGVERVGLVFGLPFGDVRLSSSFTIADRPDAQPEPGARFSVVAGEFFRALRIPLRAGRFFNAQDRLDGPGAAIINEAAARQFWPGLDPIGRKLRLHAQVATWREKGRDEREIVGVVGDARQTALGVPARPEIYIPYAQQPVSEATVVVRTAGNPEGVLAAARARIKRIDPEVPLARAVTLSDLLQDSVADRRFNMLVVGLFAAAALLLAVIGVYGVMSYSVAQRTREMGVRIALGAAGSDVVMLVVRQGLKLALAGALLGTAGALAAARLLRGLLFGVEPGDPATLTAVVLGLCAAVLAASYLPARRATRVDPMTALRET